MNLAPGHRYRCVLCGRYVTVEEGATAWWMRTSRHNGSFLYSPPQPRLMVDCAPCAKLYPTRPNETSGIVLPGGLEVLLHVTYTKVRGAPFTYEGMEYPVCLLGAMPVQDIGYLKAPARRAGYVAFKVLIAPTTWTECYVPWARDPFGLVSVDQLAAWVKGQPIDATA